MRTMWLLTMVFVLTPVAWGQRPERRSEDLPPGTNVVGKVTASGKDSLTVAPLAGGDPVTVRLDENTRVFKDRQPAKLEDVKTNDVVFVRGELKNNVIEAARVAVVNPQMMRFGQGGPGGGPVFNREDLGTKFIAGEVKAINETKLTIARPDNQSQDIEVDESTSFKKGSESITLPDIKVGDFVRGPGELKNGVFVPKELTVGRPQMRIGFATGGTDGLPPQGLAEGKPAQAPAKH